ncbi:MAG TPA: cell division protein FtsZ [Candidatus Saccharimonadales bacterium]|nr:cell division protein FtsZ [Candidatus Saccharimonadales bacterium]
MGEVLPEVETFARIKVIGLGGGGGAAIERMIKSKVQGIEFVAVNTDAQALHYSHASSKIHIGKETTRGLGAGADPEVGRKAAEESEAEISEMIKGSDMVFITLGAGGGTGTGAAPLVASIARDTGALVVGIATKPFTFEGERRRRIADAGIAELKDSVDTLITIPNDRLLQMIDRKTSLLDAFNVVDEVLQQGVQGISDLITIHGLINLDFADVKAIMNNAGSALMGIGRASGENRAIEAARQAIDSPLLEVSVDGAKGVLFNITGGRNMSMHEIDEAAKTITGAVDPDANIIFGAVLDDTLDDDIKITVVATGFDTKARERRETQQAQPVQPVRTQPIFTTPVVREPRKPFINERPQTFGEPEEVVELEPSVPDRPKAPLASIEPDPVEPTGSWLDDEPDEDLARPPAPHRSMIEKANDRRNYDSEPLPHEDDLDIPAFIRKKVE